VRFVGAFNFDSAPVYADGHIWWHLGAFEGWMAHDFLLAAKT
jgi:hypothetical protein